MIPKRIKKKETKVINSLSEKEDEINNNKYIIKTELKKERQNNITTSKFSLKKYETNNNIINNNKNKLIQINKKT